MDESQLAHELDATESKDDTKIPSVKIQGYDTNENMVSPARSEPALPVTDQATAEAKALDEASNKAADDALSVHSTSSRSFFRTPLLRKRVTDRPAADKERGSRADKERRPRSTSLVLSDDDASGLGTELTLELQRQGKEGGEWGIGDEARMSLE